MKKLVIATLVSAIARKCKEKVFVPAPLGDLGQRRVSGTVAGNDFVGAAQGNIRRDRLHLLAL